VLHELTLGPRLPDLYRSYRFPKKHSIKISQVPTLNWINPDFLSVRSSSSFLSCSSIYGLWIGSFVECLATICYDATGMTELYTVMAPIYAVTLRRAFGVGRSAFKGCSGCTVSSHLSGIYYVLFLIEIASRLLRIHKVSGREKWL
jgi:hypothetical protein